jgi:anti-sigma factor RsiW
MNCETAREQFAGYLADDIDAAAKDAVRDHIASCASCREELEGLSAVWTRLGVIPREQPSGRLRENFYAMLEEAKRAAEAKEPGRKPGRVREFLRGLPAFRKPSYVYAFSVALLIVGAGTGYILREAGTEGRTAALHQEVQDMRRTVALSMIDRPSASDRLEGVGWSTRLESPDRRTLQALVDTLDRDPNVNVRMAAVDALYLFRNDPGVKDSLVRSLGKQDSPLVQVALIDLLVEIRERRAAEALKKLIGEARLAPQVKQHAELGLKQIM